MPEAKQERKRPTPASAAARQAGDYEPPVLAEPKGGPVPRFRPTGEAARAGGEWWRLHKYWTQGEGLGRWANDPHPFKTLLAFLRRHMPEDKARRTTYDWFKEVKGFAPTGHPPDHREDDRGDPVTQREQRERERRKQKKRRTTRRSVDDAERARNELKHYWLHGEGAARWTRWTELYNHLREHVGDERAKRIAAEWFHERYGYWPGADKNRVAHGKPPRGDRIGPG